MTKNNNESPQEHKRKRGRPCKYIAGPCSVSEPTFLKSHADKLLELLSQGYLNSQCQAALNLKHDTFYRWLREHPEFKDAYELGSPKAEAFWATKLQENVHRGNDAGSKSCIMILNNNFGWGNNEFANKANINKFTQINVSGNVNVLEQKTEKELIETLKDDLKILQQKNAISTDYIILEPNAESIPESEQSNNHRFNGEN